jgi:hypothetical protein
MSVPSPRRRLRRHTEVFPAGERRNPLAGRTVSVGSTSWHADLVAVGRLMTGAAFGPGRTRVSAGCVTVTLLGARSAGRRACRSADAVTARDLDAVRRGRAICVRATGGHADLLPVRPDGLAVTPLRAARTAIGAFIGRFAAGWTGRRVRLRVGGSLDGSLVESERRWVGLGLSARASGGGKEADAGEGNEREGVNSVHGSSRGWDCRREEHGPCHTNFLKNP